MKTYNYSVSTNTIWTSFDYGTIEAENESEARKKAAIKLKYDFDKVNEVLQSCDPTIGMTIEFDSSQIQISIED